MSHHILLRLLRELKIPSRLVKTTAWYLLSLMLPADRHSQTFASKISGLASSLFSNLLRKHLHLSRQCLNRASRRRIKWLMKKRQMLSKNAPWTIALVIDATLHERHSKKCQNSQKFTHGKGWVHGHQWTNIGVWVAGEFIPVATIPFYTKDECRNRKIDYRTENKKVAQWLQTLDLKDLLGRHCSSEIVVLMDSGYDCSKIYETLKSRKLDFIVGAKNNRSISIDSKKWQPISQYFQDRRRREKIIRQKSGDGKKWQRYAVKQQIGYLKGLFPQVNFVSSRRSNTKMKCFICSNLSVSAGVAIACYRIRWSIEIFHREIKSHLGLQDTGAHSFDAVHSHVLWVFCSYILLRELIEPSSGIKRLQQKLECKLRVNEVKSLRQISTQFYSVEKIKAKCLSVIEEMESRYAA